MPSLTSSQAETSSLGLLANLVALVFPFVYGFSSYFTSSLQEAVRWEICPCQLLGSVRGLAGHKRARPKAGSVAFAGQQPSRWRLLDYGSDRHSLASTLTGNLFSLPICDGAVGAEVGLGAIGVVFRYFHDLRELGHVQLDAEARPVVGV